LSASQRRALQALPSVEAVLQDAALEPYRAALRPTYLADLVRETLGARRAAIRDAGPDDALGAPSASDVARQVAAAVEAVRTPLRRVVNATGTIMHTNLGRALLADAAVEAVSLAARYCVNVEFDLERGERGHRDVVLEGALCRLTGAEAATVANNNAAAVLIALHVLAGGREVVVSRGELIEIGGSFRLPDVMRAAGAVLREVGTTNRTHLRDYADAITEQTALLLKVHPSNYRIEGFTADVPLSELVALGRERGVPVMEDLGSGALVDLSAWGLPAEPVVAERVVAGADLVTFSGDKLLGGPQAGVIVGKRELVERVRRHPLMRAVRIGKLTTAALAATLDIYERAADPRHLLPTLRLLAAPVEELAAVAEEYAARWQSRLGERVRVEVEPSYAQVGSGAQPTAALPSVAVTLAPRCVSESDLAGALRAQDVPIIGRVERGRVWLDMRSVLPDDRFLLDAAIEALAAALRSRPPENPSK
jgi:L-seryl-tRNA(Ser) seleniumtransferase